MCTTVVMVLLYFITTLQFRYGPYLWLTIWWMKSCCHFVATPIKSFQIRICIKNLLTKLAPKPTQDILCWYFLPQCAALLSESSVEQGCNWANLNLCTHHVSTYLFSFLVFEVIGFAVCWRRVSRSCPLSFNSFEVWGFMVWDVIDDM